MTEEVLVRIKGLQVMAQEEEDEVEIITSGKYLKKGDRHYISYEEVVEGMEGTIRNMIKLDPERLEVTKKGITNVHMMFEKDKKNLSYYDTPYGNLLVGIMATSIDVKDSEEDLDIVVNYVLDINYEHMADCTINMNITSKKNQDFHLN